MREPRLLVVVGLYGVLIQAEQEGSFEAARMNWQEHDNAWKVRPEWHPALGRMLWDIGNATHRAGWGRLHSGRATLSPEFVRMSTSQWEGRRQGLPTPPGTFGGPRCPTLHVDLAPPARSR